jgi:predicted nucleic acid-binding protein
MSIVIDSDIAIYFLKGHSEIVSRLSSYPLEAIFTTRINYTQLIYGAYNSAQIENNLRKITSFLDTLPTLDFDQKAGAIFASEKARLK